MRAFLLALRQRAVDVKPDELRAMWLAFVFNFVILAGYYILRPIREEIGASSGVENLPWMYTFTLIGMLIGQIAGVFFVTTAILLLLCAAMMGAWVVLILLSVALFERETILTRWN